MLVRIAYSSFVAVAYTFNSSINCKVTWYLIVVETSWDIAEYIDQKYAEEWDKSDGSDLRFVIQSMRFVILVTFWAEHSPAQVPSKRENLGWKVSTTVISAINGSGYGV